MDEPELTEWISAGNADVELQPRVAPIPVNETNREKRDWLTREALLYPMHTTFYYAYKLELVVHLPLRLFELAHDGSESCDFVATPERSPQAGL